MTDALILWTAGLFSKWGFGDGDCPDQVLDWCDEEDLADPEAAPGGGWHADGVWHDVLAELVTEHLLPWLDGRVEVYRIETIHNPIRARTMDGVEVDDYADNDHLVERLPVASVQVTRDVVLATIRRHQEAPC